MRHFILIRSAYGPGWPLDANRRRLDFTEGITLRSLRMQTSQDFQLVVLLHDRDPLLRERWAAFQALGARAIYMTHTGNPSDVAWQAYKADWSEALEPRDDVVAMTRLDDDDAFAPWAMERVQTVAKLLYRRTALVFPLGVRVWSGGYTLVRHNSNAMHTLVTPPGDTLTVYDYGHRKVRQVAPVKMIDNRPAWVWARHPDTISGWRFSDCPLTEDIRRLFPIDWSLFGPPRKQPKVTMQGRIFR